MVLTREQATLVLIVEPSIGLWLSEPVQRLLLFEFFRPGIVWAVLSLSAVLFIAFFTVKQDAVSRTLGQGP